MNRRDIQREEGFWSALVLIFLITLALMGLGASVLMRGEGKNVANQYAALQADYAANGGVYYGLRRLELGSLDESTAITIGNGTVALDTSKIAGTTDILLTVNATVGGVQKGFSIRLTSDDPTGWDTTAVFTMGTVLNVTAKDPSGQDDPNKLVENATSFPDFDTTSLFVISTSQGHDQTASPFRPVNNYPNGSFYQADGITPNITHVFGDLVVGGDTTVYGIFIVEGSVTLNGNARVYGMLVLVNERSTIITGGGGKQESSVTGGIVSHGDINGTGNHISVRQVPEYIRELKKFDNTEEGSSQHSKIVKWEYL